MVVVFSISVVTREHEVEQADVCYHAANLHLMETNDRFRHFAKLSAAQIRNVTSSESCLFVGKWQGQVVATAYIESPGLLLYVSILPSFQKRGVGSLMLHACHQWAAAHSLKRVTAEVYVGNQAACTLYEKNGYKLVATHENVEDDEMPFHVYVKE